MSKVTGKFGQCMNNFIIAQNADVVHRKCKILKKRRAEDLRARRSRLDVRQSQTAVNPYPRSLPQRVGRKDRSGIFAFGEIDGAACCRLKEPPLRVRLKLCQVRSRLSSKNFTMSSSVATESGRVGSITS